jgi:hypothetical protein
VGTDVFGLLVLPPGEPLYASGAPLEVTAEAAPLESTEARYHDLLQRLGVQGHTGAIEEIAQLRAHAGLA